MRGSSFTALAAPLMAVLLFACGTPEVPPAADARAIDQALAEAERDLVKAKEATGQSVGG